MSENEKIESYLGDGVYASWDGYHVWLDLRMQGEERIALEPAALQRLDEFRDRISKMLREGKTSAS